MTARMYEPLKLCVLREAFVSVVLLKKWNTKFL